MGNNILIRKLLKNEVIMLEDIELYQFGIECFLLKTINYVSYIIIALLMRMPMEMLIIGLVFIPLRRSAGGYHAKTKIGCYAFSCIVLLLALWICKNLSVYIGYILIITANIILIKLAPIDNENKRMDKSEKQYFRRKMHINLLIINSIYVLNIFFGWKWISNALIMGMCISAFLLVICKKER